MKPPVQSASTVTFDHLTLQTGHNYVHRDFIPDAALHQFLVKCTAPGFHRLNNGYGLLVSTHTPDHWVFSVHDDKFLPLVFCHACLTANSAPECWLRVMEIIRGERENAARLVWKDHLHPEAAVCVDAFFQTPPIRQPQGLFLAVALSPGLLFDPSAANWLGDFERCMYWALWRQRQISG